MESKELNSVQLIGRLTMDPDLRYTPSGAAVLGFRIAVDRVWKDKTTDDWKKDTSFFSGNLWGPAAERQMKVLRKGSPVIVEGQLRSRSWEGKEGEKHYVVEINATRVQSFEKKPKDDAPATEPQGPGEQEPDTPKDVLDDVPF